LPTWIEKMEKTVRILYKLEAGMVLDIYEDFQDEIGYQGKAILIEKIKDGDSYYLMDEELKPSDQKSYDDNDKLMIVKYNRLVNYFKGNERKKANSKCKLLYTELIKLRRDKVTEYEEMNKLIDTYRTLYKTVFTIVGRLLSEYDNFYIIRYIQQDRILWRPAIFSSERWKVKFIEDHTGWFMDFTTNRNIRVIKCVNPKEGMRNSDLVEYTTYDGISSKMYDKIVNIHEYHKKKDKLAKELKEQEEYDLIDDDEIENLINNKYK
jgi:hypothetical protein